MLIPLQHGSSKLVLVGDPCQLPATLKSRVRAISFSKFPSPATFFDGGVEECGVALAVL